MTDTQIQLLLRSTGPNATQSGLAEVEPTLNRDGITLQRNSQGEIRGRLYWQTGRVVDVVDGAWGTPWAWIEREPGPTPPTPPDPPPTVTCQYAPTDLAPILLRLEQLEAQHLALLEAIRSGGWPVEVSGKVLWSNVTLTGRIGAK